MCIKWKLQSNKELRRLCLDGKSTQIANANLLDSCALNWNCKATKSKDVHVSVPLDGKSTQVIARGVLVMYTLYWLEASIKLPWCLWDEFFEPLSVKYSLFTKSSIILSKCFGAFYYVSLFYIAIIPVSSFRLQSTPPFNHQKWG